MQLIMYPRMGTLSKRCMTKVNHKGFVKTLLTYQYRPKIQLLRRLVKETGFTIDQVADQIQKERAYLLKLLG